MLDKIPTKFWKSEKKVFEPCAGKGGFVIDIIDRFMNGLKKKYIDEKERYKVIVEKCLYFSDINPTNIFICELLIDPDNEYQLNSNKGDTLQLDIKEKWNIDGFDAIIGNPPYQSSNATGDNKLYLSFIKKSIEILYKKKYLLFIVPINIKNYITNQNKNRSYIDNFLKIEYLSLNTANKHFPTIGTFFSYFLLKNIIVDNCETKVSYLRKNTVEEDVITISQYDNLPLCMSQKDIQIINKVSNLMNISHKVFNIKKAMYIKKKDAKVKNVLQRIRKQHISNGDISEKKSETHKYKIIDKLTKNNPFPGIYYYNEFKMKDYGNPKVIMCKGGYLMPSFDKKGEYNLSDNMIYLCIKNISEFKGLEILIKLNLIKYLNKVTMTDGLHGRDKVIQNIKYIELSKIKNEQDVYNLYNIDKSDLEIINKTL